MNNTICSTVTILCLIAATAQSAEIRLRAEAPCSQTLVTLADLADIVPAPGEDAATLAQTVITTAPAKGDVKTLSAVEIRDILSRSGVNSQRNLLTGATNVTLVSPFTERSSNHFIQPASYTYPTQHPQKTLTPTGTTVAARGNVLRKMPVTAPLLRTLEQQLGEAIGVYLNFQQSQATGQASNLPWKVSLKLSQEQGRLLASSGQIVDIFCNSPSGNAALTGPQRFGVRMQGLDETTGQNIVVTVDANVRLPQEVLVVKRALPKGFIISANDVMLRRVDNLKDDEFIIDAAEVIGMETVRAIDETTPLTSSMLRRPLYVQKGDIVTIHANNTGTVRTQVTALADGCEGDMIPVETIDPNGKKRTRNRLGNTDTFLARVCGPKNVEVFASSNVVN